MTLSTAARSGSKIHLLSEGVGLPLTTAISAANTHDSHALKPLVRAIPAISLTAPAPPLAAG